jgi:hypothetical protein
MIESAQRLLSSFDATQRASGFLDFANAQERVKWFYTPTDHGGLPLANMSSTQHRLVHQLLASALSEGGYVTTTTIMGLENVLDRLEGFVAGFERERGRDPLLYWVSIFGTPSETDTWGSSGSPMRECASAAGLRAPVPVLSLLGAGGQLQQPSPANVSPIWCLFK